jgi:hypothetical protein
MPMPVQENTPATDVELKVRETALEILARNDPDHDYLQDQVAHTLSPRYSVHPQFANSYASVLGSYRHSPFGRHHAQQRPRFMQRYPYDDTTALADLGTDVHPVEHMQYTHDHVTVPYILGQLIAGDTIDTDDITALRLAALTHDIGECTHPEAGMSGGDAAWDEHTDESIAAEVQAWQNILDLLKIRAVLPQAAFPAIESIVGKGKGTEVEKRFEVIERTGYYLTAVRAARLALDAVFSSDLRSLQLTKLAIEVGNSHRKFLLDSGTHFPAEIVEKSIADFTQLGSLVGQNIYT